MIGIIGSGNVGANSAFFLAEKGVDDVMLFDIQEGTAEGKALDMMEAAPIRGYCTTIQGSDDIAALQDCDIIIITAGAVRKPGMKRDTLFMKNRQIIETYASKIVRPDTVVIMVTEPVDLLTTFFARQSPLAGNQILGLGGILDVTRLRFLIARELSVSMENIAVQVIGRHTDEMILLESCCCVSGVSIEQFISRERLDELFDETKTAGHLIIDLAQRSSAYYGPSAVVAEVAQAIRMDTGRVLSVSHLLSGQYGINDVALSLPAVVGKKGVLKTMVPDLSAEKLTILKNSAARIEEMIKEVTS